MNNIRELISSFLNKSVQEQLDLRQKTYQEIERGLEQHQKLSEQYEKHLSQVEERLSNGSKLTKHEIDL